MLFAVAIDDQDGPVPVVTLLTNGEHRTLEEVERMVDSGLPIIVVKGSGGAANVLHYAIYA